jgi:hypothetical protein
MPDQRHHRGRHPDDDRLFARKHWENLRQATADLSWLLTRDYAAVSSLKLVGDRYQLEQRQRIAVARAACSDQAREARRSKQVQPSALRDSRLAIDGFNVLLTLEAALAGGVLLHARDGCLRDMASVHGTYRKVAETLPAIDLVSRSLVRWGVSACTWYLDAPVSNSGRLAQVLREHAQQRGLTWQVELVNSPDQALIREERIVASADSVILDGCRQWLNFTSEVLAAEGVAYEAIEVL